MAQGKPVVALYINYTASGETVLSDLNYKLVTLSCNFHESFLFVSITRDPLFSVQDEIQTKKETGSRFLVEYIFLKPVVFVLKTIIILAKASLIAVIQPTLSYN